MIDCSLIQIGTILRECVKNSQSTLKHTINAACVHFFFTVEYKSIFINNWRHWICIASDFYLV